MDKKSFILHLDSLDVFDKLSDEQIGKLLRKMKSYHNGNTYVIDDILVDILFSQFKNQFDRDNEKFNNVCERNREIANKRWKKNEVPDSTKSTTGKSGVPKSTRNAESDSDSDSDSDINNNKQVIIIEPKKIKTPLEIKIEEFVQYRKESKKAIGPTGLKNLISRLQELSKGNENIAMDILNQSMANGWQGIFEIKQSSNKDRKQAMSSFNIT